MARHDFGAALREADRALERFGMPDEVDRRLQHRLFETLGRPRRWPTLVWLGLGVCATAALVVVLVRPESGPAHLRSVGGMTVVDPSADLRISAGENGEVEVAQGDCTLVDRAWGGSFRGLGPLTLRRERTGLRVVRGVVEVRVQKRAAGSPPARVLISDGTIEVLGTRFTVSQRADGGQVALYEGLIEFTSPDGRVWRLEPGDMLAWPLDEGDGAGAGAPGTDSPVRRIRPEAPLRVLPPAGRHAPPPDPSLEPPAPSVAEVEADLQPLLQQIAVLRSRGLYEQAARTLEQALHESYAPATLERVSFELGSILTYHLGDAERACTHWRAHRARYPAGRYDREVHLGETRLGCSR